MSITGFAAEAGDGGRPDMFDREDRVFERRRQFRLMSANARGHRGS
ncbi:MAG: hypothetical protein MZU95_08260 [Desulfomicrobium escambiense]|nr:hypothetical protein [Desulfomicrobium escambiense]